MGSRDFLGRDFFIPGFVGFFWFKLIVLYNIWNPKKNWDFIFLISITGSWDIRGSCRGLARSCNPVSGHASATLGMMWKQLQIKDQCGSDIELTRNVESNQDQLREGFRKKRNFYGLLPNRRGGQRG